MYMKKRKKMNTWITFFVKAYIVSKILLCLEQIAISDKRVLKIFTPKKMFSP